MKITLKNNPTMKGMALQIPNIVYSTAQGPEITLDLLMPWIPEGDTTSRYPLIVFIQGSAWHCPDTGYEMPQLSVLAKQGWVIATVRHRNVDDGYPVPAFLQDVKTAIRFLRANAEKYHIDDSRVYSFGTSSGGNTSLLLGLTGDMEEFRTSEYPEYSDHVDAVVECFGPSDVNAFIAGYTDEEVEAQAELFPIMCGGKLDRDLLAKISPVNYVTEGREYVPFMIVHGNADPVVPIAHSERMVELLEKCGASVDFITIDGAEHEGTFWSEELWGYFIAFLNKLAGK